MKMVMVTLFIVSLPPSLSLCAPAAAGTGKRETLKKKGKDEIGESRKKGFHTNQKNKTNKKTGNSLTIRSVSPVFSLLTHFRSSAEKPSGRKACPA